MPPLLDLARNAATQAGEVILSHYGSTAFELKGDNSPVTQADQDANDILIRTLTQSGIAILSEENEGITLPYPDRLWIIDPLDGTKGFINHTDDFSVMIALVEQGRPTIAVVFAPVMGKLYYATLGGGAFVVDTEGERQLHVSDRRGSDLRALFSVNHLSPYMLAVAETLGSTEHHAIGSVGIKAGYIAENKADFYLTRGPLGEWDVAAPELILREAGGTVTDEHGDLLCYGNADHRIKHGIVLSNSMAHENILAALKNEA